MSCQACIRAGLVCDALGCATWSKVMGECTGQLEKGSAVLKAAKVTLDRETHAREAAEAELRETAGELEKARARVIKLEAEREQDLSQLQRGTVAMERSIQTIDALRARVKEATDLLTWGANECEPALSDFPDAVGAFLASRAPAQPAAPTSVRQAAIAELYRAEGFELVEPAAPEPEPERCYPVCDRTPCPECGYRKPAAPEPSAGSIRRLDMQPGILLSRAESAEAQLAAVTGQYTAEDVVIILRAWRTLSDDAREAAWEAALLTPAPSPGAGSGK